MPASCAPGAVGDGMMATWTHPHSAVVNTFDGSLEKVLQWPLI